MKADFVRFRTMRQMAGGSKLFRSLDILAWPMFHATVVFRLARAAERHRLSPIARILMYLNEVVWFVELSSKAVVGPGLIMLHPGNGCAAGTRIGRNCTMVMFVHMGVAGRSDPTKDGTPTIGDDVVLSANSSVWGPVTVGSRSTIGTGVRVMKDVPEDSLVIAEQAQRVITRAPKPAPADAEVPEQVG
ncbi:MAG: hypothetical protein R2726_11470 [Acidimicrobiales bacterium]